VSWQRLLVVALFLMWARRISRRLAPFAVAATVIVAIGFAHRRRRETRAENLSSAAEPAPQSTPNPVT
jgi:hypothetical protein